MSDHEAESHEVEEAARGRHELGAGPGLGSGRPLPLNSKRLTGVLLKQLARGLEIPATSSGDELCTLIEGKLGDMGHDPRNTQAVLHEAETGVNISLQDADGVFLTVKPIIVDLGKPDDPPEETIGEGGTESEDEGVEELKAALREAQEQQAAKEIEIARLQEQLEKEKEKYRKLWSLHCTQLTEFDNTILDKDKEIGQLKARLHRAEGVRELLLQVHLQRGRPRAAYLHLLHIEEGEPLMWRCSAERIVRTPLRTGYLL